MARVQSSQKKEKRSTCLSRFVHFAGFEEHDTHHLLGLIFFVDRAIVPCEHTLDELVCERKVALCDEVLGLFEESGDGWRCRGGGRL